MFVALLLPAANHVNNLDEPFGVSSEKELADKAKDVDRFGYRASLSCGLLFYVFRENLTNSA